MKSQFLSYKDTNLINADDCNVRNKKTNKKFLLILNVLTVIFICSTFSTKVAALDGPKDRRGLFTGIGIGGSGIMISDDVGADMGFELQLGGGATQNLTFALDIDTRLSFVDGVKTGMLVPGPEITYFILGGLNVHAGIGLALVFPDESDFALGFNFMGGAGYEFFVNTNLAFYMNVDVDLFKIDNHEDSLCFGLWIGIKYY